MKQFVIIGVGAFGARVIEELLFTDVEVLIIDKREEIIEQYKNQVSAAYIADVINEEIIKKIVPNSIDAAIVDVGGNIEASVLVTNYLNKLGVRHIIAKAETNQHGEILEIVGASHVVFPNREAAKRIVPPLVSSALFNYLPISKGLVIAEVRVPPKFEGKSLIEANLRREYNLNVIAITDELDGEFHFFKPDHKLEKDDILLIVGHEADIAAFSGSQLSQSQNQGFPALFRRLLTGKKS